MRLSRGNPFLKFTDNLWSRAFPMAFLLLGVALLLGYLGCGLQNGSGNGDLTGLVLDTNQRPISGARVSLATDPKIFDITDKKGEFRIGQIDAQDTTFIFSREGYLERREVVSLLRDSLTRFDLILFTTQIIQNVNVTPFSTSAFIDFTTTNSARPRVFYGVNPNVEFQEVSEVFNRVHSIQIKGLTPASTYFFRIETLTDQGNIEKTEISTFETRPADPIESPKNFSVVDVSTETKATLVWDNPISADIIGYNLYRSQKRGEGFTKINSALIQDLFFEDTGLKPGQNYVYQLKSVNSDSAEGETSAQVSFIAPGLVSEKSALNKENNPHYLPGDLVINKNVSMEIGPGVVIYISPTDGFFSGENTSLVEVQVNGSLRTLGSPLDRTTWTLDPVKAPTPEPGSWLGFTFSSESDGLSSKFSHNQIFFAQTGILAESSTVEVTGSEFNRCNTAINFSSVTNGFISSNTIQLCELGIRMDLGTGTGTGNKIEKNLIKDCDVGILLTNNQSLLVRENHLIQNGQAGIIITGDTTNLIQFNLIQECQDVGIAVTGSITCHNNTIQAKNGITLFSGAADLFNNILLFFNPLGLPTNQQSSVINNPFNPQTPVIEFNLIDPTFNQAGISVPPNILQDPQLDADFKPLSGSPATSNLGRNGTNIGRFI